jgi:hypothetical protein
MSRIVFLFFLLFFGVLPKAATADAERDQLVRLVAEMKAHGPGLLKQGAAWVSQREFVKMLLTIGKGGSMGGGEGWFGPGESRYDFAWLAQRHGLDKTADLTRQQFRGPAEFFAALDMTGDGILTSSDFDWSDKSPFLAKSAPAAMLFSQMDANSNGRISRDEWQAIFDKIARDKEYLSREDLRQLLQSPPPAKLAKGKGKEGKGRGPSSAMLMAGLLSGEVGSPFEGPRVGRRAPDFTLSTPDGEQQYTLSEHFGKKPTVLVFGSFT